MIVMLILGSIGCALALKFGGEAKAHEISKTRNCLEKFYLVEELLK